MRWLDGITDSMDMSLGKLRDNESDTTEQLNNNNLVTIYPIYAKYQLPSTSSLSWRFEVPFLKKLKNSKMKKTSMLAF